MAGYTKETGPDAIGRLLRRVREIPGVVTATIADRGLDGGGATMGVVKVPGGAPANGPGAVRFNWHLVSPGYFATLGTPLVAGRDFADTDRPGSEPVAIVGERTARRLWPGRNPIGQYLETKAMLYDPARPREPVPVRVVGVVADRTPGESLPFYVPIAQRYLPTVTVMTKVAPGAPSIAAVLSEAIDDEGLPVLASRSVDGTGENPVQVQLRIAATVAGSVGVIGLLLAAVGIYGVTAYAVSQRTREIGIRLSLGAGPRQVVLLVLRQGMTLVAIGAGIGLMLGIGVGRLLASSRFGVPQSDAAALGGAALLFLGVGFVACYLPVRRAARIRAIEALRYE
jgi:hypothetical protein